MVTFTNKSLIHIGRLISIMRTFCCWVPKNVEIIFKSKISNEVVLQLTTYVFLSLLDFLISLMIACNCDA